MWLNKIQNLYGIIRNTNLNVICCKRVITISNDINVTRQKTHKIQKIGEMPFSSQAQNLQINTKFKLDI